MFVTKLKMAALAVILAGLLAGGGALTQHVLNAAPQPEAREEAPPPAPQEARKTDEKKTKVHVVRPTPGGLERRANCIGSVRAAARQQVYPAVSGFLKQPLVDIGDRVKKGQVLVEIDAPLLVKESEQAAAAHQLAQGQYREAKAQVATAEADMKTAEGRIKEVELKLKSEEAQLAYRKKQSERYAKLLAVNSIDARLVEEQENHREAAVQAVAASKAALLSARSVLAVKQSQIESAKVALASEEAKVRMAQIASEKAHLQVDFTRIRARFDGIVTRRNFDAGDFVSTGDPGAHGPLLTVQRMDTVRVVVNVDEKDVLLTRVGTPAVLYAPALKETIRRCQVSRIGFALDERDNSMPVEIDVPNRKGLLRPGMSISAVLALAPPSPKTFTLPPSCLIDRALPGSRWIYLVRDGKAHRTKIQVGLIHGDKVEVLSGVRADDRVVSYPRGLTGKVVPIEIEQAP